MSKPVKTLADYLVVSISPVLIMLLVGSLTFFLIEVFFRGPTVGSVRWVMFWFVMAVVLVSRIGIEQGTGQAMVYGLGLAAATWLYLVRIHPAFIMGLILLGIVWWCAHKLTWDCTLIDEDEDASGGGLLETGGKEKKLLALDKAAKIKTAGTDTPTEAPHPQPHSPGLWVVYFSLAALPLFGVGQMLLPRNDVAARHAGFTLLFVYVTAAVGLLLTTSFLGLRRYLRQRYLPMPPMIAFGWIRFGVGVAAFVLVGALLVPRPGANDAWKELRYHVDYRLRQASDYAMRFGPHGKGEGRPGNETQKPSPSRNPAGDSQPQSGADQTPSPGQTGQAQSNDAQTHQPSAANGADLYRWFKVLFLVVLAVLAAWWVFRKRDLLLQIARSFLASLAGFFRDLFKFSWPFKRALVVSKGPPSKHLRFAGFQNPFLSNQYSSWPREQLVLYSFEALQAWAEEHGVEPRPDRTAREFCAEVSNRFPEITPELSQLSWLYSHAAYRMSIPGECDLEPLGRLWRFLGS